MNILVLKDLGDPWDWVPAGCGQDHSVEERGGEKNFKKEAKKHLCSSKKATEYIFLVDIRDWELCGTFGQAWRLLGLHRGAVAGNGGGGRGGGGQGGGSFD